MKKFLLFLFALLSVCSVKAVEVKVADHDVLQTTYGTITSNVFTSNDASGLAGVTITSGTATIGTTALNFATSYGYKSCFSVTTPNTSAHTVTITAPEGYLIAGYSMYMKANSSSATHTVTPSEGGSAVSGVGPGGTGIGTQLTVSGIETSSTYFTVQTANKGNALYFTYFTVYLVKDPSLATAKVTYKVVDANGTELWVSDPVNETPGETISSMPSEYKNKPFTTYTDGDPIVVADGDDNVFTCTATFENMPFKSFTTLAKATWYKATIRTSKYVRVQDTEPYYPTSTYQDADNFKWAFQGNPYTGITIYNKSTGDSKTLGLSSATINGNVKPTAVMLDGETRWDILSNSDGFVLLLPGHENYYVNQNGGESGYLGFWVNTAGATDDGSTWRLTSLGSVDDQNLAALTTAVTKLSTMTFGSNYGQYGFVGDYAGYRGQENSIIPGLITEAAAIISAADPDAVETELATVQTLLANLALNVPANGSAFRLKSRHDTYMTNVAAIKSGTSYRNTLTADATDPNTIMFYVDGKIYCYGTESEVLGSGSTYYVSMEEWNFVESTVTPGKYAVRYTGTGTNDGVEFKQETRYLFAWSPSSSYPNSMDHNTTEEANCDFTIEAVETLPVVVSDALHATLYLPVGVQAVEGLTLNSVTSKGNDYLALESVASIEPKTPVIVKADAAGTYNLPVVNDGETVDGNLLTGVAFGGETIAAEVNAYILGQDEQGVGLFPLSSTNRTIASWKAYYVPAGETSARAFYFSDVTGLNKADLQNANEGVTYDLQGRRVQNAQKGLYIVNGKKVLVK